ncbi:MAG: sulfatase-like hydrolase/transferase [Elusimicrobiota bacterium]|nr:sulfatase-like hydrolase/transferase [Elusimicrobiota bacterium]
MPALAAFLALATLLAAGPARAERPRGVILISVDALRADRLAKAPRMSRLAASGVLFREAVAQAPWTLPSMGTAFTSLLPGRHGLKNRYVSAGVSEKGFVGLGFNNPNINRLSPHARTLAEAFRDAGWDTAAFTGDAGLDKAYGFARGFEVYHDSRPFAGFDSTVPPALDWLARRGERPFFLFLHGYDAHGQYEGREPGRADRYRELRRAYLEGRMPALTPAEKAAVTAAYDEQVARADERVGAFLDAAARLPAASSGVVVALMSDHGDELFERGGVDHGPTLYDEVLRVVLAVAGPGIAARRVDQQVRLLDLAPTLLDLAGVSDERFGAQAQGVSLRPLMRGERRELDAVAETDYLYRFSKVALRTARGEKLVMDLESLRSERYDLRADPGETRDLADADPAATAALEKRLRAALGVPDEDPGPVEPPPPADDLRMRAEALRRRGRFKEAAGLYEKARRVDPEGLQDHLVQGYSRMASGDVAGATRHFEAAVALSSGSPMMRHHEAVQLYLLGEDERALTEMKEVAAAFKDDEARWGDYLHALMWVALLSGEERRAEELRGTARALRAAALRESRMRSFYHVAAGRYLTALRRESGRAARADLGIEEICSPATPCDESIRSWLELADAGRMADDAVLRLMMRHRREHPVVIPRRPDENDNNPRFFECMLRFEGFKELVGKFAAKADDEGCDAALAEAARYDWCVPGRAARLYESAGRRHAASGRAPQAREMLERAARLYEKLGRASKGEELRALTR